MRGVGMRDEGGEEHWDLRSREMRSLSWEWEGGDYVRFQRQAVVLSCNLGIGPSVGMEST